MAGDLRERLQATLGGAYTLERELGGGGMSRVFVATESRLGRRVVVKVLRSEIAAGTSTERFEREMALCARCHHPHIVPLLAAGEVGGLPWFTMPLVEGESLRDRLAREGPLPVAEAVRLLAEVTDALAYAHRLGIVHRDIKPENILLQDGHAVVADFGVAKAFHAATQAESSGSSQATGVGVVIGTPAYMAPEQAMGDPAVDHRVDLYALGVVAFELLTGRHPFDAITPQAMLSAQLARTPPPLTGARPGCPPLLAALVGRLLAKDPADRPATAEAVRADLLAIASGAPAAPGSRPRAGRVWLAVAAPFLVISLLLIVLVARHRTVTGSTAAAAGDPGVKSLAVLPFQRIGGDSSTNYFGDGIADELISALGRLTGLRVASRTSAFAARERSSDLREIGRRLDVSAVLEGTVQQSGRRVKVTARLVDVARDAQLWDGEYRSEVQDVFAVQDTIAHAIAAALKLTLAGTAGTALVERGTSDTAAHDLYLRGRYFLAFRTPAALRKAIDAFQAAARLDSAYALAWAGLADAYSLAVPFSGLRPDEVLDRARAAATRALALDSTLAEVHTSLGFIATYYDHDVVEAERRFSRALELNPSYAQAHLFRAWSFLFSDRRREAFAELERARELDPLSLIINTRIGTLLHYLGQDREAIPALRRALELDSTFAQARAGLALSYAMLGRFREALAMRPNIEPMLGNDEAGEWGVVLALAGRPAEARQALEELEAWRKTRYVAADALAAIHAALGETDAAFAELDRAAAEHSFSLMMVRVESMFNPLHADPRWTRFLALTAPSPAPRYSPPSRP